MTDNTPLNADDELQEKVAELIAKDLFYDEKLDEFMQLILADRKKYELHARLSESTAAWGASCDMPSTAAISRSLARRKDYLKQELDKL